MFPQRHVVAQTIERQDLTKELDNYLAVLTLDSGGSLETILRGSDATFARVKDGFLNRLEAYIKTSMTKLYTTDQNERRRKEVKLRLSQNLGRPEGRSALDGMVKFMASMLSGGAASAV